MKLKTLLTATSAACLLSTGTLAAGPTTPPTLPASCALVPNQSQLQSALSAAVATSNANGGLGFNMWATVVGNDGAVCAVAYTGGNYTEQWLASRVISAQKAATANSLSLAKVLGGTKNGALALASGNLYSADREGGSLFGLQFSNPVNPVNAYGQNGALSTAPDPTTFGTTSDPMVGLPIGGINVFGGGLALYNSGGQKVGGIGVSGDTSCTDHMVAWRTRAGLKLDYLAKAGVSGPAAIFAKDSAHPDNLIFDIPPNTQSVGPTKAPVEGNNAISPSGFGHPQCLFQPPIQQNPGGYPTAGGLPTVE
jgi:uncharacterized protein GlcG (DUF336 family)